MSMPNLPPGFDFTDPDIYAERLPIEELAQMRKVAPIWWNEQPNGVGGFNDGGLCRCRGRVVDARRCVIATESLNSLWGSSSSSPCGEMPPRPISSCR
jgi:hypothetical protein